MDARENVARIVEEAVTQEEVWNYGGVADSILALPELEAYFREKFENEPGRLVAEKGCLWHLNRRKTKCARGIDCPDCHGTGTIKRRMTRKEVEEWAVSIILSVNGTGSHGYPKSLAYLPSGERVSVEEK